MQQIIHQTFNSLNVQYIDKINIRGIIKPAEINIIDFVFNLNIENISVN